MMCSGCSVLAVVGHYVPGIMISYIIGKSRRRESLNRPVWKIVTILRLDKRLMFLSTSSPPVLSVLLWPLVVYHELIQRMYTGLEPILMKLDYSMKGETEHRKHDKRSE